MDNVWLRFFTAPPTPLMLRTGCSSQELELAERELGVSLPEPLASFLQTTNGFTDLARRYSYAWDLRTIVLENSRAWSESASALDRGYLAFGADGTGGLFCLSLSADGNSPVYHRRRAGTPLRVIADDLAGFWPAWLDGSLAA